MNFWDAIPFIKLFVGTALALLFIYIVIRVAAYAISRSIFQAKHEYEQNKENDNGKKEES